jgi:hypothetical protein
MKIVQAAIGLGTQAVLWSRSPFGWRTKLLMSLSYFLLFEYGAIARSYGLGVLLFFAFIALRRTRWSWGVLAALPQVEAHVALLAGAGALLLLWERKWSWAGACLLAGSGLVALHTMWPAAESRAVYLVGDPANRLGLALQAMASALLPAFPGHYPFVWQWAPPVPFCWAAGAVVPLLGWLALRRDWRLALIFVVYWAILVVVAVFVYPAFPRHVGFTFVLLIGLLWAETERLRSSLQPTAMLWLALQAVCGLWVAVCSFVQPFALSDPLGRWIVERNLATAPWAAYEGFLGTDVSGEIARPTFNVEKGCWNSFIRWDYDREVVLTPEEVSRRLAVFSSAVGGGYLLSERQIASGPALQVEPLAAFGGAMVPGTYYVYRLRPPAYRPSSLPNCR